MGNGSMMGVNAMRASAVVVVAMSAGQGRRELNGDQNHRRTCKLPKLSFHAHGANSIILPDTG